MKSYRADLHIHTLLSPCGDLEMSPDVIISRAVDMHLDIIGITDHNSTRQCQVIRDLGKSQGILVLMGVEVTTREEVHCLAFFDSAENLGVFQQFLDAHLPDIPNDLRRFGYQVVVDHFNNIVYQENRLLISALAQGIESIERMTHTLNGLFVPAHVDRTRFGVLGQLGFIPSDLTVDAIEISQLINPETFTERYPELDCYPVIGGSDAHHPDQIGKRITLMDLPCPHFDEIRSLFRNNSRKRIKVLN